MRYKITLAYEGTRYSGWQVQANAITIQPLVQKALETFLRHPIDLTGSSRTDAHVHALGQTAHFDSPLELNAKKALYSWNALLPEDIRIFGLEKVPPTFHARYSATSKIYHYHLHLDPVLDPFRRHVCHHVLEKCDVSLLEKGAKGFLGTHDFTSFANHTEHGIAARDPIRTLSRLDVIPIEGGVRLEFEADGFLYKMVRNLTGTLLEIARGKIAVSEIEALFTAKDRRKAPMTAPPQGLVLYKII